MINKIVQGTIVVLVGIHVLNWNMQGIGWKGNWKSKLGQIITLPWSLI